MENNDQQSEHKNELLKEKVNMAIGESTMKHGWCKTVKNAACCYQTPFDVALILEQVSKHNVMTIEQIRMGKDIRMQQHDEIGEGKIIESKLRAKAKEYACEGHEQKKNDDDMNETVIENEWMTPKKGMTMKHVCEKQEMKENKSMNDNKHKELSCDEEK